MKMVKSFKKKYNNIEETFRIVIKHFDAGNIHKFRLEVKKLNSLLRLAGIVHKHSRLLALHKFYKAVGIIRSPQLQQQRIVLLKRERYKILSKSYLKYLKQAIADEKVKAVNLIKRKKPFGKEVKKIVDRLPERLKRTSIQTFIDQKMGIHTRLLKLNSISDESLHVARKSLKDMVYISSEVKESSLIPSSSSVSKKTIHATTKLLGEFHDKCVSLDLLQAHVKLQPINTEERKIWHDLENEWWEEKERDRVKIHAIFKRS